jgi:Epoxide hydrolase N terminus
MKNEISPFRIEVTGDVLNDLRRRLEHTRWPWDVEGTNWDAGSDFSRWRCSLLSISTFICVNRSKIAFVSSH